MLSNDFSFKNKSLCYIKSIKQTLDEAISCISPKKERMSRIRFNKPNKIK